MLGESTGLEFVPQLVAAGDDGELACGPRHDVHRRTVVILDRSRETRGLGLIVSLHAIADFDRHELRPFMSRALATTY